MTVEQEIARCKALLAAMPAKMADISQKATERAVMVATNLTPPQIGNSDGSDMPPSGGDDLRGTHTRTGMLKDHWDTDSIKVPQRSGNTYITHLKNTMEYASYVNDGHRMDRHFVPGLYVNPYSGLLEYDPTMNVGIIVGTQTQYVPGLYMVESAESSFNSYVNAEFSKIGDELK